MILIVEFELYIYIYGIPSTCEVLILAYYLPRTIWDTEECVSQTTSRCDTITHTSFSHMLEPLMCKSMTVCPSIIPSGILEVAPPECISPEG